MKKVSWILLIPLLLSIVLSPLAVSLSPTKQQFLPKTISFPGKVVEYEARRVKRSGIDYVGIIPAKNYIVSIVKITKNRQNYYYLVVENSTKGFKENVSLVEQVGVNIEFETRVLTGKIAVFSRHLIVRKIVIVDIEEYPPIIATFSLEPDEAARDVVEYGEALLIFTSKRLVYVYQGSEQALPYFYDEVYKVKQIGDELYIVCSKKLTTGYQIKLLIYKVKEVAGGVSLENEQDIELFTTYNPHKYLVDIDNSYIYVVDLGVKIYTLKQLLNSSGPQREVNLGNEYFLTGFITEKYIILLYFSSKRKTDMVLVYDKQLNPIANYSLGTRIFLEKPETSFYSGIDEKYFIVTLLHRSRQGKQNKLYVLYIIPGRTAYMRYVDNGIVYSNVVHDAMLLVCIKQVNSTFSGYIYTLDKQHVIKYDRVRKHVGYYYDRLNNVSYLLLYAYVKESSGRFSSNKTYLVVHMLRITKLSVLLVEGLPATITYVDYARDKYLYYVDSVPSLLTVTSGVANMIMYPITNAVASTTLYSKKVLNIKENSVEEIDVRRYFGRLVVRGEPAMITFISSTGGKGTLSFEGGEGIYYIPPGTYSVVIQLVSGPEYTEYLEVKANETVELNVVNKNNALYPSLLENSLVYIMLIVVFAVVAFLVIGSILSQRRS